MVFRDFGGTNTDVTKGIITFFDLLMKRPAPKLKREPTIKLSECTKDGFERFVH